MLRRLPWSDSEDMSDSRERCYRDMNVLVSWSPGGGQGGARSAGSFGKRSAHSKIKEKDWGLFYRSAFLWTKKMERNNEESRVNTKLILFYVSGKGKGGEK